MLTKNQLLLSLAKDAVNWGEGADFEMQELIHEADKETHDAIVEYYPEFFIHSVEEEDYPDTEEGYKAFEKAEKWASKEGFYSQKFYSKVSEDINDLLNKLIEQMK